MPGRISCFLLLLLGACEKETALDQPPKEFQGIFYEVSSGVIQGDDDPLIYYIGHSELAWRKGYQMLDSVTAMAGCYPIRAVGKKGKVVFVYCGKEGDDLGTFELSFSEDGFLSIYQVAPDLSGNDARFLEGIFTSRSYLKLSADSTKDWDFIHMGIWECSD